MDLVVTGVARIIISMELIRQINILCLRRIYNA